MSLRVLASAGIHRSLVVTQSALARTLATKAPPARKSAAIDDDEKALVAQMEPIAVEVKAGKAYFWCSCGRSQKQPFCDSSHKGTSFKALKYVAEKDETLFFCACKQTGTAPLCDGTHAGLAL